MRAVIQRVKSASVKVDSKVVSSIGQGLLVLVGITADDTDDDCSKVAQKILKLRLWPDSEDSGAAQWQKSVTDINGGVICVSQFTLYARVQKGTKPDFHRAHKGEHAKILYDNVQQQVKEGLPEGHSGDGVFGAMMDVALVNDGPVTIIYDTKDKKSD